MLQIVTLPTAQVIDLAEARLHVKQDISAEDSLLRIYIGAATQFAESQTERTLLATRYRLVLDAFPGPSRLGIPAGVPWSLPGHAIELPRSPLIQIVSIQYLDMGGTLQTLPSTDYVVDDSGHLVRITPQFGKIWPITLPQIGAVRVLFDAGYATPAVANAGTDTLTLGLWKQTAINDIVRLANSGMANLMAKLPGMGNLPAMTKNQIDDKLLIKMEAMIISMTHKERRFPDIIKGSRKRRIAAGSGTEVQEINRLLKQSHKCKK